MGLEQPCGLCSLRNSALQIGVAVPGSAISVPVDRASAKVYSRTMTIELTREQERLIEQQLATGNFTDKGDVIGEALALLQRQGEVVAEMRGALREAHSRNANLDPQAESEVLEDVLKEHRQRNP